MHILFICNEYPPAKMVGGIGIFMHNITQELGRIGHSITVIGLYNQPKDTEENDGNIRVVRIATKGGLFKLGWWSHRRRLFQKIKSLHTAHAFDIAETSDFDAGFWLMPSAQFPRVVRINGGEVYFRTLLNEPLKWKHRLIERQSILKADYIAAVSNFSWDKTFDIFNLAPQERTILPNFVDIGYFSPDRAVKPVSKRLLYTGTFIRKKGVLELFKSLNSVFLSDAAAHLVCIGSDTPDKASGEASTRMLALQFLKTQYHSRVTFIDRIPNAEIKQYLLGAEVCVYPSFMEAHPNVILEAMACAKAIVSSILGPGPETIEHGTSGLLCHPENTDELSRLIILALSDSKLRQTLGENARQTVVSRFSSDYIVPKNVEWYSEVIRAFKNTDR